MYSAEHLPIDALDPAWVVRAILISTRVGAMLLLTPVFSASSIPVTIRMLAIIGLGSSFASFAASTATADLSLALDHPGELIWMFASEVALGVTLGVAIHLAFSAFSIAGKVLDIQIGFGLAQVLDPLSNSQLPILTTLFNQTGVVLFFVVDGHHALMRAIAYSLERFPPGRAWPIEQGYGPIAGQVAGLLGLAFALMAPVVLCIFLVDLSLGMLARNLPQINMLTLGISIKIVAGLIALSLWTAGSGAMMTRIYSSIYVTWTEILAPDAASSSPREIR
jgi:flagellar biosynthesis protein FliR